MENKMTQMSPEEIVEANICKGVVKANLPFGKMVLLGIMAGAFIALEVQRVMLMYTILVT